MAMRILATGVLIASHSHDPNLEDNHAAAFRLQLDCNSHLGAAPTRTNWKVNSKLRQNQIKIYAQNEFDECRLKTITFTDGT
jgi:hypothetical protein